MKQGAGQNKTDVVMRCLIVFEPGRVNVDDTSDRMTWKDTETAFPNCVTVA